MNSKNKLSLFKSTAQNFRDKSTYMGNMGQAKYVDSYNQGEKDGVKIPF